MRARSVSVALLLLLWLPRPLEAQLLQPDSSLPQPREGFWFSGGLGIGLGDQIGGQSASVAVGCSLSPRFLLALGSSDWRAGADGTTLTMGTLDLRTQFYPEASGGFFLTGGLGLGYFRLSDSGTGADVGRSVLLGLGYDARIRENVSITTFVNKVWIHTPDPRGSVGQIGVGLTFH